MSLQKWKALAILSLLSAGVTIGILIGQQNAVVPQSSTPVPIVIQSPEPRELNTYEQFKLEGQIRLKTAMDALDENARRRELEIQRQATEFRRSNQDFQNRNAEIDAAFDRQRMIDAIEDANRISREQKIDDMRLKIGR